MIRILALCCLAFVVWSATYDQPGFHEQRLATGLNPTKMAALPDGRLLICEKQGLVRVAQHDVVLPEVALDLSAQIDTYNERGLVGMAVDPQVMTNGFVYLFYTARQPVPHNRISRFTLSGNVVVAGSEAVLLDLSPLGTAGHHNGGGMVVGLDGLLYVGTGENGTAEQAQDLGNTHGKILRLTRDPAAPIPADNPFLGQTSGPAQAIACLGARNPFTLSLDPASGDILIGDVGGALYEEVNRYVLGANYGWPTIEGPRTTEVAPANYQDPWYSYDHSVGICVLGGVFYRPADPQAGVAFPASFTGRYLFADLASPNWIRSIDPASPATTVAPFSSGQTRIVATTVSAAGALYYLQLGGWFDGNSQTTDGSLWKVVYTGSAAPTLAFQPSDQTGAIGAKATFGVSASGTGPFTYQWTLNGAPISNTNKATYTTPALTLAMDGNRYACTVSSPFGSATSTAARLTVTSNTPPSSLRITKPTTGTTYSGGLVLSLDGTAKDNDGVLPDSAYSWDLTLFHANHDVAGSYHQHPFAGPLQGRLQTVTVPLQGENDTDQFIRITMTVTDSGGLSTRFTRDYLPTLATLTLNTDPVGGSVLLDGALVHTPATRLAIVGYQRTVTAVAPINFGFDHWSDGGALSHVISPGVGGLDLTAVYAPLVISRLALTATKYTVDEGGAALKVWVSRTLGNVGAVSVRLRTRSGTALLGQDLDAVDTVLAWADGDIATKSVQIPIVNDAVEELQETAYVDLLDGTGFPQLGPSAAITIRDDDSSLISFASTRLSVVEGGSASVAVTRQGAALSAVSVQVKGVRHATVAAATTSDVPNLPLTTLSWEAGDTTPRVVTIPTVADSLAEGNETFGLSLASPVGFVRLGAQATLTVLDDDLPQSPDYLVSDLGASQVFGQLAVRGADLLLKGGGTGLAARSDSCTLALTPLSGDGVVEAQIASLSAVSTGARVGVTLRSGAAANAALVALDVAQDGTAQMYLRAANNGTIGVVATSTGWTLPCWLHLERHLEHVHGEMSSDGVAWTQIGTVMFNPAASLSAGAVISSKANNRLAEAVLPTLDVVPVAAQ